MALHPPATPNSPREADRIRLEQQAVQHHLAGRLQDAIACYSAASALGPLGFDMTMNWSIALRQSDQLPESLRVCGLALEINPLSSAAHGHQGDLLLQSGDSEAAIVAYRRALDIEPRFLAALRNLADALIRTTRLDDAERALTQAAELDSQAVGLFSDLAGIRHQLGRYQEALLAADRALEINPSWVAAQYNRGLILEGLQRYDDALDAFQRVRALDPSHVEAAWNSALIHLRLGRYVQGWPLYEMRKRRPAFDRNHPARRELPPWGGPEKSPEGARVLVLAEQGLGDTLQFCRYAAFAARLGVRPTLVVQDPLTSLLRRSLGLPVVSRDRLRSLAEYDAYGDLLSLPALLADRLQNPWITSEPYLHPDPQRAIEWQQRLSLTPTPRIGLMWRGRRNPSMAERSIGAAEFFSALPVEVTYFALQQSVNPEELAAARACGLTLHTSASLDFEETAALICQLDLVVSIDTSIAHLAGALGQKTWLLLPKHCDWRWGTTSDAASAYRDFCLLRNRQPDSWSGVLDELSKMLRQFSGGLNQPWR